MKFIFNFLLFSCKGFLVRRSLSHQNFMDIESAEVNRQLLVAQYTAGNIEDELYNNIYDTIKMSPHSQMRHVRAAFTEPHFTEPHLHHWRRFE
ncbi:Oidioi.mRNA.OKI2018_I69.chr2.g7213.t1.cds [Oikopleura dioica]|uniref:Oidioi.mRNA.OKI2018_I69.chr2.g7213.t1.cds n=1 Tax=Oikopleura dioica TaxID=34765 RepID=A0ABN7TA72_OIKDI|nr:Oidioi.mRNA.OKI2018_I69.chr2.g7213.t1.cds [Oikopleura dioica]